MSTRELLLAFFEAENQRDWAQYRQFLHPEVTWWLYGDNEKIIQGIKGYLETIQRAYQGVEVQFRCEHMFTSRDGRRIVSYLVDDEGKRSVDIFEFKDGLIYKEYEFLLQ
ncbi:MAG: nuclear transport factor 2 family protein [Candidatus Saccharibacteria bacterium]|nr:nuclear transport factor 2 family protein [Candidatus Saccharibacteria bacterium]